MNEANQNTPELEDIEIKEWLSSLDYVLEHGTPERAQHLLQRTSSLLKIVAR